MRFRSILACTAAAVFCLPAVALTQAGAGPSLLISPAQLSKDLRDPSLVLLQVGPPEDYQAGHIAGARLVALKDLAAPQAPGALILELPDEADLRGRLERLGISDNSRIVVVPGADWGSPATRVVWTLQVAGLGARTQVLEGGSGGWVRAGLPVTTVVPPEPTPGRLTRPQDRSLVVDHAWIQAHLGSKSFHLIDARGPVFFEGPGMNERGMRHDAGHIPGARNLPFNTLFNDSLQFPSRDELQKKFAAAGVQPGDTVVAYCHVGQQATMVIFAARLLGYPAKLYDGSFNDWETRHLPIENPKPNAAPGSM